MVLGVFGADDISLFDNRQVDTALLLTAPQVTESYLLALACAHQGQLATFDRRLAASECIVAVKRCISSDESRKSTGGFVRAIPHSEKRGECGILGA
jgi:hypothetical protein